MSRPSVSVIMPVKNGGNALKRQLDALGDQDFDGTWELIVSDQSTDESRSVSEGNRLQCRQLRIVDSRHRPGPAGGRNVGAEHAEGETFVFCDHDDIVLEDWLTTLVTKLDRYDVVVGACKLGGTANGNDDAGLLDSMCRGGPYGFLPFGLSANMGIRRQVFEALGGFDESLRAAEDIDLCWRAQLAGYRLGFEPAAIVRKTKRPGLMAAWHQHANFGQADAGLFHRHRANGMPRMLARSAKAYGWILVNTFLLWKRDVREQWIRVCAQRLGRLRGSLANGVFYP
jgi:GT2 family glycosyltransferase